MSRIVMSRIVIERLLDEDGQDLITVVADDSSGETLPLIESLGMLRLAEDTVLRDCMGEIPDDEYLDDDEENES